MTLRARFKFSILSPEGDCGVRKVPALRHSPPLLFTPNSILRGPLSTSVCYPHKDTGQNLGRMDPGIGTDPGSWLRHTETKNYRIPRQVQVDISPSASGASPCPGTAYLEESQRASSPERRITPIGTLPVQAVHNDTSSQLCHSPNRS
jgi:hypothetical protein